MSHGYNSWYVYDDLPSYDTDGCILGKLLCEFGVVSRNCYLLKGP